MNEVVYAVKNNADELQKIYDNFINSTVNLSMLKVGLFIDKPSSLSNNIYIGFQYFCTDRKAIESETFGIPIFYIGNNTWVDALGRVIY